jgi:hypothetical protein
MKMERSTKLVVGILLLAITSIMVLAVMGVPRDSISPAMVLVPGVFGILAMVSLISGFLPGFTYEERRLIKMKFSVTRVFIGVSATVVAAVIVYLSREVLPMWVDIFIPDSVVFGALLAVPFGLLYAGTAWTEACRCCETMLEQKEPSFNVLVQDEVAHAIGQKDVEKLLELYEQGAEKRQGAVKMQFCKICLDFALVKAKKTKRVLFAGSDARRLVDGLVSEAQSEVSPGGGGDD